jgi:ubiquinone/menaquinone biosynthesis C-methylase UbiE
VWRRVLSQVVRYVSILGPVEELGGGALLDVGGGDDGIAGWLSDAWAVTAVDVSFAPAGALRGPRGGRARLVRGDAHRLPFDDGAFDAVLALDVLEHIPRADREQVVEELVRTARRRVIIGGPTGAAAMEADLRLAAGLRRRGVDLPPWLTEHEQHGMPDIELVARWLGRHGTVRRAGCIRARRHERMKSIEFRRPGYHASRALAPPLAAAVTSEHRVTALAGRAVLRALRGGTRGPAYRTIAILDVFD